jgi:hypothetical protein
MFGLFTPRCPLPADEKTWVERRMLWLAERFGLDRLRTAPVVLPTEEFFPDRYDADYPSVRRCLDRICGYMDVEPRRITLEILPDEMMPNAAGWYQMRALSSICVAYSQLADPMRLMATLAHEVAHEILLRGGHLTGSEDDHEQTTDLLPTLLGVGIFGANATIREASGFEGGWSWWSVSLQGYLSSFVLGYAHALFAFVRWEASPDWATHLRPDARGTLSRGLRYLLKTGDSLIPPPEGVVGSRPSTERVLSWLSHKSPTYRIAALWDVVSGPLTDSQLLDPVVGCLADRDDCVRAEAAWAVAAFGAAAASAVPQLVALLSDSAPGVRAGAARSLGAIRANPEVVVPELARLVSDHAAYEAIGSLGDFGADADAVVPQLVAAFALAVANNDDRTTALARALGTISPDPQLAVRDYLGGRDPELLRLALEELGAIPADAVSGQFGPPPRQVGIPFPRVRR